MNGAIMAHARRKKSFSGPVQATNIDGMTRQRLTDEIQSQCALLWFLVVKCAVSAPFRSVTATLRF
ncbi:MAG: hypothetical protein V3U75_01795 [Methylococcaceae bacterium]